MQPTQDRMSGPIFVYQSKGLFRALRNYSITATPVQQRQVMKLAPTVKEIRPEVYKIGACVVDMWRLSCSCKTMRARKLRGIQPRTRPCVHFITLFMVGVWTPCDPDPCQFLKTIGVQQPEIIATYCHASLPACYPPAPKGFRILAASVDYAELENLATGTHARVPLAAIRNLTPFYA